MFGGRAEMFDAELKCLKWEWAKTSMVRHLGFSPSHLSHQANAQQKLPSPLPTHSWTVVHICGNLFTNFV
jgi:hypothetical protein